MDTFDNEIILVDKADTKEEAVSKIINDMGIEYVLMVRTKRGFEINKELV